jgi:hypothetical protein
MRVLPLFGKELLPVFTVLVCENSELDVLDKLRLLLRLLERTTSLSRTRSLSSSNPLSARLAGGESSGNPLSLLTANGPASSLCIYRGNVGLRSNVSKLLWRLSIVGRAALTGRLARGGLGLR